MDLLITWLWLPLETLTIPVQADASNAACGTVPSVAKAYSFNVTLIPVAAGQVGYVTVWPAGATQPVVATINDREGVVLANAAIVPAGTPSGGISVYNSGPAATNVVIDMNGFFAAPTDLYSNTAVGSGRAGNQHYRGQQHCRWRNRTEQQHYWHQQRSLRAGRAAEQYLRRRQHGRR